MASKLREDLPSKPSRLYNHSVIKIFDQHRKEYLEGVARTKKLYGGTAMIVDDKAEKAIESMAANIADPDSITNALLRLISSKSAMVQQLVKVTPKNGKASLSRNVDVITAFYVPDDLKWMEVEGGGVLLGRYTGKYSEIDVEEILRQSHEIPEQDDTFLEYILWRHRKGKRGRAHSQAEEITIDGQVYKRAIYMHPLLPLIQCQFHEIKVFLSEVDRPFYIEGNLLDTDERNYWATHQFLSWIEDETLEIPLCRFTGGMCGMMSTGKREQDLLES